MDKKPILFNTPMVQALLDGSKSQTRRILKERNKTLKFQPFSNSPEGQNIDDPVNWGFEFDGQFISLTELRCPLGSKGDLLYVRENFTEEACASSICYEADFPIIWKAENTVHDEEVIQEKKDYRFKPSIHMLRSDSRLTLEITDIKVERLNKISKDDAIAEGIKQLDGYDKPAFQDYTAERFMTYNPIKSFKSLWESIEGKDSWKENPFVCCAEFEVHKCNVDNM